MPICAGRGSQVPRKLAEAEGLAARQAKIPADGQVNIPDSAKALVTLFKAWGKPDQAAEWEAKALRSPSGDRMLTRRGL